MFFDDSLESGAISIPRREVADECERRLGELHDTLSALEAVRGKLLVSPPGAGEVEEEETRLCALERELLECREDLRRDEEIFSEKVNELNRFR